MIDVFLSASVPLPTRNREFYETADILAIRESIKALVEVILPVGRITFGGHPAITPLLALFSREANLDNDRIFLYQSDFFKDEYPNDIKKFLSVNIVPAVNNNIVKSLVAMRHEMIKSKKFHAAVLIGGMEGLLKEHEIFVKYHPHATILPIPTTGAAAEIIFNQGDFDHTLARERTYSSLFRRKLLTLDKN